MKMQTALLEADIQGTFDDSSAIAMGIDQAGLAIVMNTLSNMYSDASLAVVREYSCNARDSHVEAGNPDPIHVKLPTSFDPILRVQDFGVGLSKRQIIEVYAQYGASTKRDSNQMIGAFGIGSKAAFTVGNEFIVTGVKDSEKTVALFAKDRAGLPTVQIMHHGITDEPNGVTVDITVDDPDAISRAADKLFRAWPKGSVLVDDEEPESMWVDTLEEVCKDVYLNMDDPSNPGNILIVMGGVPYSIPAGIWYKTNNATRQYWQSFLRLRAEMVINVSIGAVEITPSREELRDTPVTVSTIERMIDVASSSMAGFVSRKIESAPNIFEATVKAAQIRKALLVPVTTPIYWRSLRLSSATLKLDHLTAFSLQGNRQRKSSRLIKEFGVHPSDGFGGMLFVTDVPENKFATVRRYGRVMLEELDNINVIVISKLASETIEWFSYGGKNSPVPTMTFADYHAKGQALLKDKVSTMAAPREKTRYDVYAPDNDGHFSWERWTAAEIVASGFDPLYFVSSEERFDPTMTVVDEVMADQNLCIVEVDSRKSPAVLERNVVGIERIGSVFKDAAKAKYQALSGDDRKLLKQFVRHQQGLGHFTNWAYRCRDKITHPQLRRRLDEFAALEELTRTNKAEINRVTQIYREASMAIETESHDSDILRELFPAESFMISNIWGFRNHMQMTEAQAAQYIIDRINA